MTGNTDGSAELVQLIEFAEAEDWLYQAELRLADQISAVAVAFSKGNPGTEVICRNYIGRDSVLRLNARSSILRSIKSIEKSLDKFQGLKASYRIEELLPDYFAASDPAKSFFCAEIVKRNLKT